MCLIPALKRRAIFGRASGTFIMLLRIAAVKRCASQKNSV
jgi:hypothetical protein